MPSHEPGKPSDVSWPNTAKHTRLGLWCPLSCVCEILQWRSPAMRLATEDYHDADVPGEKAVCVSSMQWMWQVRAWQVWLDEAGDDAEEQDLCCSEFHARLYASCLVAACAQELDQDGEDDSGDKPGMPGNRLAIEPESGTSKCCLLRLFWLVTAAAWVGLPTDFLLLHPRKPGGRSLKRPSLEMTSESRLIEHALLLAVGVLTRHDSGYLLLPWRRRKELPRPKEGRHRKQRQKPHRRQRPRPRPRQ